MIVNGTRALLAIFALMGCETDNDPSPTWMLGVFSSGTPGPSRFGSLTRYRVLEGGELRKEVFSTAQLVETLRQSWTPHGSDAFLILPGRDDTELTQERYHWSVTREGPCGPYAFETHVEGSPSSGAGQVYLGELCVRGLDLDPMECGVECDGFETYWCEGSPPPCGEEG